MWGLFIKLCAQENKTCHATISNIINDIRQTETMNKSQPNASDDADLFWLRLQLSTLLHKNFSISIAYIPPGTHRSKPGSFLTRQYKCKMSQNKIPYLTDRLTLLTAKQKKLLNPLDIVNQFSKLYSQLYNLDHCDSEPHHNLNTIQHYLSSIQLPMLLPEQILDLSSSFTKIVHIISQLSLHKSQGPYDFSKLYYKNVFWPHTAYKHLTNLSPLE